MRTARFLVLLKIDPARFASQKDGWQIKRREDIIQSGERLNGIQEVSGSIPLIIKDLYSLQVLGSVTYKAISSEQKYSHIFCAVPLAPEPKGRLFCFFAISAGIPGA